MIELAPYGADIVVEKPMALTLEDADKMIETRDRHGVRLFVVKQNRFNVPVVELRKALEAGRFGSWFWAPRGCAGVARKPIMIKIAGAALGLMMAVCLLIKPAIILICWNG